MGKEKGGFLTPKAISNRIKAKGLQKLRWYCEMCQKQCRDENGFKCHLMSESHQRQLLLFSENPNKYISTFSQEFLDTYLELLRRRFGTKRVHANIVYQEYISDRTHTHMNATQWETLTDLVKWLGKEGHCVVDETEKGWFIQYIDRDPEAIRRQEALQKKEKMSLDDQERNARFIQQQVERARTSGPNLAPPTQLSRPDGDEKVVLSLNTGVKTEQTRPKISLDGNVLKSSQNGSGGDVSTSRASKPLVSGQKRKTALDDIMEFEEKKKEKVNRKDNWLHKDIVVKVMTKALGDKYYKKKAVVKDVEGLYAAVVKMVDSGDKLKVDQAHLETVIPGIGKTVLIVNGAYRGTEATLVSLQEKAFSCTLSINAGPLNGRILKGIQYEDVSKVYVPS